MAPDQGGGSWSPYVSADVHARVAWRVALLAGIRGSFGTVDVPLVADALADPSEDTLTPELSEVSGTLGVQPLELPGTRLHLFFGARIFVR
jgi:hypothetical protein